MIARRKPQPRALAMSVAPSRTASPWIRRYLGAMLLALVVLELPSTASATWGPANCERAAPYHCYGRVAQTIEGTGSFVKVFNQGGRVNEPSTDGTIDGDLVTNEMWIYLQGPEHWIETGEIIGTTDCCTRWRFYAENYPGSPLYYHIDYEAGPIPLNQEEIYGIEQCNSGHWCIMFGGQVIHQFGGWPRTYQAREAGIEIGTETKPSAYGSAVGIEGNGKNWFTNSLNHPIEEQMEAGICEAETEPGVCGFNRYEEAEVDWGFGNAPHDRVAASKRHRHQLNLPMPKRAMRPIHRHATVVRDSEGRVVEMWVGRRPTKQERTEEW
jgi:hypothetical protein